VRHGVLRLWSCWSPWGFFSSSQGAAFSLLALPRTLPDRVASADLISGSQVGLDQIVRDVNDAGFPPPTFFQSLYPFFVRQRSGSLGPRLYGPNSVSDRHRGGRNVLQLQRDFDIHRNQSESQDAGSKCNGLRYQLQGQRSCAACMERRFRPSHRSAAAGILAPFRSKCNK